MRDPEKPGDHRDISDVHMTTYKTGADWLMGVAEDPGRGKHMPEIRESGERKKQDKRGKERDGETETETHTLSCWKIKIK